VVIDEIKRRPGLFPVIRVLADRKPLPARILILGSASPTLLRQSSETLAGRMEALTIRGFSLTDSVLASSSVTDAAVGSRDPISSGPNRTA
jgi:hypothetical protein